MEVLVLILYGLALLLLFLYNCGQLSLIIVYLRSERKRRAAAASVAMNPADLPRVTVQLPVYNELYVIERLIDAVAQLKYPRDKVDIQVLDDSSDETVAIIAAKVAEYQRQGLAIEHIRRPERTGYKAGALAYGTAFAKGDFIRTRSRLSAQDHTALQRPQSGHCTDPLGTSEPGLFADNAVAGVWTQRSFYH